MELKIRVIIIEDEYKVREVFKSLLIEFCPEIKIVAEADNINDGYELINKERPELIFLDIEMPGGNGFELLSKFDRPFFETIFVTSYGHYAIKAIKYSALDYLLKPVMIEEIKKIVSRYKSKSDVKNYAEQYKLLKENLSEMDQKLVINNKSKLEYLNINDIICLKADSNYTIITTNSGKKCHTSKTLKDYDEILCGSTNGIFIRVHKSCIVNPNFIQQIENGVFILLKDGSRVEVSRRKKQELLSRLGYLTSRPPKSRV